MECPQCKSDNTQRLEVIYENGTQDIKTTSSTVGAGFSGRGGLGVANTTTTGKSQSMAAQKAAPPERRFSVGGLVAIVIGLFFVFVIGGGAIVIGALCVAGGGYLMNKAMQYNKNVWPGLYQTWQASWYCQKCGTIYQH
ncbi:MAG: hypothetical protein HZC22_19395 [Rhodocyclales bacterium]|nr:hypothetical protein [Rhodocyclales bacterium]